MRTVPRRTLWTQGLFTTGALFAGPLLGLGMAAGFAPESGLTQVLGVLGFATVLLGGSVLWMGVGVVAVVSRGLWRLARGQSLRSEATRAGEVEVPPGYRVFLLLGLLIGGFVGFVGGVVSDLTVVAGVALWTGAGGAYGAALSTAAARGYLPFPEPE